jgi:predicted RNA-binding protein with PUA-like domain
MAQRYWLFKSEPEVFSWSDLKQAPSQTTLWDGVRNYQARNLLRDEIQAGDLVFFYHSRVDPQVIAGIARVVRRGYPDPAQFDPRSRYFDEDSDPASPRWFTVDVQAHQELPRPVTLQELRAVPGLEAMELLRKGSRLSVQPVTPEQWSLVLAVARSMPGASGESLAPPVKTRAARGAPAASAPKPRTGRKAKAPEPARAQEPAARPRAAEAKKGASAHRTPAPRKAAPSKRP